ncbi:BTB-domain-containing protein [Gigaspora margarita]|uniref:BTB-domain-containing protein n=1 Tax=Gigaspora margarita TaxID=4874 RepID=A0A8H4ABH9_GIGMA|nr:BTB-domain-containing protein [Gigaspora margarita]
MAITHFRDDLCQDISQLFENADDYNAIIQIGIEPGFEEFKAHSVILRARCPYFKIALSDKWVKKIENTYYLPKPNISPVIFILIILILRYIYTGTLDLTDQPGFNILALLVAVDELLLDQLINHIQEHFIDKEYNWLKENFVMALPTISKLQNYLLIKNEPSWFKKDLIGFLCNIFNDKRYKTIQDYIMDTICIDPEPLLFELEGFPTLERDIILEFIKRDDLAIEEIDVWKYLVKWTKAQYSSLSEEKFVNVDINTWGDNELTSFKKYLEPFISYIRFCEMARDEFYYHITPYGKKNARIIVGWIEGITAFTKKLFCEFSCIYRATYYGFDSEKFIKELSDSDYFLSKTSSKVLLIKIKDSDLTIGGHISSLSRWSSSKILSFVWEAKQVLIFISLVPISNILTNHG